MIEKTLSLKDYMRFCCGWHICRCFSQGKIKVMPVQEHNEILSHLKRNLLDMIKCSEITENNIEKIFGDCHD
jgi:hypothetical protein